METAASAIAKGEHQRTVAELEEIIEKLTNSKDNKEEEVFALHEDLLLKEDQIVQLESTLESRKTAIDELKKRVTNMEEVNNGLAATNGDLKKKVDGVEELNHNLQTVNDDLEKRVSDIEELNHDLQLANDKLRKKLDEVIRTSGTNY